MALYISASRGLARCTPSRPDPVRWKSMAVIGVAQLLLTLDMTIVNVALPTAQKALYIGVDERDAGVASALVNTAQQVGGSIGTALLNTVATAAATGYTVAHTGCEHPTAALPAVAATHGYTVAFAVSALLLTVAVLTTALMVRERAQEGHPDRELSDAGRNCRPRSGPHRPARCTGCPHQNGSSQ